MPLREGKGQNSSAERVREANFECEHPARCSRRYTLIGWYLDKATAFSSADWYVVTAKMPLRDGKGRDRSRICESEKPISTVGNQAQLSRRDALIRGYLNKATLFSGADWCVGAAHMPLKDGSS